MQLTDLRIFITGIGLISPLGNGLSQTRDSIKKGKKGIRPLSLFPTGQNNPLPVGEISDLFIADNVPRTHKLAFIAAKEAMAHTELPPDAVVIGSTTGGILTTEANLKKEDRNPESYRYHSTGTVSEYIAREYKCRGPAITVSTACSSGAAAIKIGLEMLRTRKAENVLVGGADSLCRLTYYGFNSLQLIDPRGARPFDKNRRGMSVAEGAAMLFLTAGEKTPDHAIAEILGAGLSCDAWHIAAPDPQGRGAVKAMVAALKDADISPADIDYVNAHGTGTWDNDLSEAKALRMIFGDAFLSDHKKPCFSSVKGAFGHPLGASGAIEAVISAMSISDGLIPGNIGCDIPDPELLMRPVSEPSEMKVQTVLSNSFGFGGNNASIVIGDPKKDRHPISGAHRGPVPAPSSLTVLGCACVTGAGNTDETMTNLSGGKSCKGRLSTSRISENLERKTVRRLKRLPRLALSLADAAYKDSEISDTPSSVFFGTGWGPLSDTYDFLTKLYESGEQFTSPTDFIGSVHNAPAGQIAIQFKSTGPNITTAGGDYSFEQALMAASLLTNDSDDTLFVIGADESHEELSPLFDNSVLSDETLSDGGGAFCLKRTETASGLKIFPAFFERAENNPSIISSLISSLGGAKRINETFGAIFAGIPMAYRETGEKQLGEFLALSEFKNPIIDYRKFTGEFASASAVATVLAIRFLQDGEIPVQVCGKPCLSDGKGVLIIGLGNFVTATRISDKKGFFGC